MAHPPNSSGSSPPAADGAGAAPPIVPTGTVDVDDGTPPAAPVSAPPAPLLEWRAARSERTALAARLARLGDRLAAHDRGELWHDLVRNELALLGEQRSLLADHERHLRGLIDRLLAAVGLLIALIVGWRLGDQRKVEPAQALPVPPTPGQQTVVVTTPDPQQTNWLLLAFAVVVLAIGFWLAVRAAIDPARRRALVAPTATSQAFSITVLLAAFAGFKEALAAATGILSDKWWVLLPFLVAPLVFKAMTLWPKGRSYRWPAALGSLAAMLLAVIANLITERTIISEWPESLAANLAPLLERKPGDWPALIGMAISYAGVLLGVAAASGKPASPATEEAAAA